MDISLNKKLSENDKNNKPLRINKNGEIRKLKNSILKRRLAASQTKKILNRIIKKDAHKKKFGFNKLISKLIRIIRL